MFFLSSLFNRSRATKTAKAPERRFLPRVEELEAREVPATFTVTNTSGNLSQSGSLPWAVAQADQRPGMDTINFNIPGSGRQIINLSQTLFLTDQVVIRGDSQPGYNGTPLIYIHGSSSVPSLFLMTKDPSGTTSSGSTIQGLGMYAYTANAITILKDSSGNTIQNNWMGFHPVTAGVFLNSQLFSFSSGLGIQSGFNKIINNTIAGTYNAINVGEDPLQTWSGTVYASNIFSYNRIGTDPTGSTAAGYGNAQSGIFLGAGAQSSFIGPGNVISGNGVHGVEIYAPSAIGNVVFGNVIGMNTTGSYAIPNGQGVLIAFGANGNAIGNAWGGNYISGNINGGIYVGTTPGGAGNNNYIENNVIGLNANQTAIVGSQSSGIVIQSASTGNVVRGNVIGGQTVHGVVISGATGNYVLGNWIGRSWSGRPFANAAFGVALLPGGSFNTIVGNAFGANAFGPFYINPQAVGNFIQ
ncbi:MAG: hypothetical protein K2R98_13060 [Gemmataceae bacterium]|nr:hypothetical protein [Gemmataceae bacterium]